MEGCVMANLPQFQSDTSSINRAFQQLQNQWAAIINPVLAAPQNKSSILKQVSLAIGSNVINHLLGQKLQGWKLVRQRAKASIYDTQDSNPTPALTLVLVSDAACVVDIEVY